MTSTTTETAHKCADCGDIAFDQIDGIWLDSACADARELAAYRAGDVPLELTGYAVVVDHGYTFANDVTGARFTPETARAFAAERNAMLKVPTYVVYLLAPDTGA